MEQFTYQNIKSAINKKNNNFPDFEEKRRLVELLELNNISKEMLEESYYFEMEEILKYESLHDVLNGILEVDFNLDRIEKMSPELEIPSLSTFYKCLSPLVLRTIKDSLDLEQDAETSLESVKEAIRICIEEVLFS